jgi:hypothetical protein
MIKTITKYINAIYNHITGPWFYAKNVSAFNEYIQSDVFKSREEKFDYTTSFGKFLNLDFDYFYAIAFKKNWFNIIFRPLSIKPDNIVLFAIFINALYKKEEYEK